MSVLTESEVEDGLTQVADSLFTSMFDIMMRPSATIRVDCLREQGEKIGSADAAYASAMITTARVMTRRSRQTVPEVLFATAYNYNKAALHRVSETVEDMRRKKPLAKLTKSQTESIMARVRDEEWVKCTDDISTTYFYAILGERFRLFVDDSVSLKEMSGGEA